MRSQRNTLLIRSISAAILFVVFAAVAHAQVSVDFPTSFAGFSSQDLKTTIENIVRIILGFIGIIFFLLVLYGGFVWMFSGGDEKKISQAKRIIVSAVVGLLLTLASYAIASFIIRSIGGALRPGPGAGSGAAGGGNFGFALGAGALESHYPGRNAIGVPRNAKIFVTFKEPIKPDTVCSGGKVLLTSVEIQDLNNGVNPDGLDTDPDNNILDEVACSTTDNLTFKLSPAAALGTQNGNVVYRVTLHTAITTAADKPALSYDYHWQFTVSNVLDLTAPTIVSVYPEGPPVAAGGSAASRNAVVQITFSEPVDPTTVSGFYGGANTFDGIKLDDDGAAPYVAGSYSVSNGYRTVEFLSNTPCGVNSCGVDVFCLPVATPLTGTVMGTGANPVADMAGNAVDGEYSGSLPSGDGSAGGDFVWRFDVSSNLDLSAPFLIDRKPSKQTPMQENISLRDPLELTFNEPISTQSVKSGVSAYIAAPTTNYWIDVENRDWNGIPASTESRLFIKHDRFPAMTQVDAGVNSKIMDLNQNCYFPAACDNNRNGTIDAAESNANACAF